MMFEEGKCYRTTDGRVAGPLQWQSKQGFFMGQTYVTDRGIACGATWTRSGNSIGPHGDLVHGEVPRGDIPVKPTFGEPKSHYVSPFSSAPQPVMLKVENTTDQVMYLKLAPGDIAYIPGKY